MKPSISKSFQSPYTLEASASPLRPRWGWPRPQRTALPGVDQPFSNHSHVGSLFKGCLAQVFRLPQMLTIFTFDCARILICSILEKVTKAVQSRKPLEVQVPAGGPPSRP